MADTRSRALSGQVGRRDLPWRGSTNIWVVGEITPPDPAEVRARLRAVGRTPQGRRAAVLQLLDPASGTTEQVTAAEWDDFADALVVAGREPWQPSPAPLVDAEQDDPLGTLPFRLRIGPSWATLTFNHMLGDSSALWPAFMALMHPGGPGDFSGFPLRPGSGLQPLRRALTHTFGQRPGHLLGTVRATRVAIPLDTTGEVVLEPPRPRVAFGVSAPGYRKQLREAAPARGLSVAALMTARAHALAPDLGLRLHPGAAVVVDCRRYLPTRDYVEGNFCAGSYLAFADPADPVEVGRSIEGLVDSGRPLLAMALSSATTRRGPHVELGTAPDPEGRSLLSVSHVGRLPWPKGGLEPPMTSAMSRAVGDHGIALITIETRHEVIVSVTWAEGHQDPATMAEYADRLVGRGHP